MVVIGVLALQGAVEEHVAHIHSCGAEAKELRLPRDFAGVDGIILPGCLANLANLPSLLSLANLPSLPNLANLIGTLT